MTEQIAETPVSEVETVSRLNTEFTGLQLEIPPEVVFVEAPQPPKSTAPDRPEPLEVTKVTHHNIELNWKSTKEKLPRNQKYKFILQTQSQRNKGEWQVIYTGYGITKNVTSLQAATEYVFRLIVQNPKNVKSDPSADIWLKTEREPLTGDNLHKAIQKENVAEVERILNSDEGKRVIEIPDKYDHSPLMIAVQRANIELVELLIFKGAPVDAKNETGKTALMLAAFYGKINIIKELTNNGASYKTRDKSGSSVLHYAVDGGVLDAIQYILMDGHEVDPRDEGGWTPLIRLASMNGNKDAAAILISYNCDLDAIDGDKKNALTIAVLTGNLPLVTLLVESGANIFATNEYGKTPYDIAIALDKRKVIKYFEEYFERQNIQLHATLAE